MEQKQVIENRIEQYRGNNIVLFRPMIRYIKV